MSVNESYKEYIGSSFTGKNTGKTYVIDSLIGSGGEGGVFAVRDDCSLAAKIFSCSILGDSEKRARMNEKLSVMLKSPIEAGAPDQPVLVAWPIDALYRDGEFFGYIMPRVNSTDDLDTVIHADICRARFPELTWKDKAVIARSLAKAVQSVHDAGHVIGDLNHNDVLIDADGAATIIGTDAFWIRDKATGRSIPCEYVCVDYKAPELSADGDVSKGELSPEVDWFALAVIVFRLLMDGYHPFYCKAADTGEEELVPSIMESIAEGKCPYVNRYNNCAAPSGAPTLDDIPPAAADLFRRVFDYDSTTALSKAASRPNAQEWCDVLTGIIEG